MKLAIFNEARLGVVQGDCLVDVTSALPEWEQGPFSGWWNRFSESFSSRSADLARAAKSGKQIPLDAVRLQAPALSPTKIVAAAANYKTHVQEMRTLDHAKWLYEFGVFLKAPSSIVGPDTVIVLPEVGKRNIQHESELAFVIGKGGKDIPVERAWDHILGYTCLIDVTVRGDGDRSERKSYDGFCPLGPWLVTSDEIPDAQNLQIRLWVNGELRQDCNSSDMIKTIPEFVSYASRVMTLNPGDVMTTGSPPGVGDIREGDEIVVEIERVGRMAVRATRKS